MSVRLRLWRKLAKKARLLWLQILLVVVRTLSWVKVLRSWADWLLSVRSDTNHAELTISCAVVADVRVIQARLSFMFRPKMI